MPLPYQSQYQQAGQAAKNIGASLNNLTINLAQQRFQQQMAIQHLLLQQEQMRQQNALNQAHIGMYGAQSELDRQHGAYYGAQAAREKAINDTANQYGTYGGALATGLIPDRPADAEFGPIMESQTQQQQILQQALQALAAQAYRTSALQGQPQRGPEAVARIAAQLASGPMTPDIANAILTGTKSQVPVPQQGGLYNVGTGKMVQMPQKLNAYEGLYNPEGGAPIAVGPEKPMVNGRTGLAPLAQVMADPVKAGYLKENSPDVYNAISNAVMSISAPNAGGSSRQGKPMPAKKSDLVTGEVYQTSRGPATWNGTKFVQ